MHNPTWPEGRTNLSPRVCEAVAPYTVRLERSDRRCAAYFPVTGRERCGGCVKRLRPVTII
eukprot:6880772-Prymnesium_polylepis.1